MINIVQGTHGTEFDRAELPIEAGVGTIWVTQTQSPQVIVPDTQDTRRVMTFAPQGQEGAVWMRGMRSPLAGTSRWWFQSTRNAPITITPTVSPKNETKEMGVSALRSLELSSLDLSS
jgi:hypothetical protein